MKNENYKKKEGKGQILYIKRNNEARCATSVAVENNN